MRTTKSSSDVSLEDASGPVDFSKEVDMEKNGRSNELQRQVSEPPYSVWSKGAKIWIIFLVSVSALISPFGATTFLPALTVLTDVLDITPSQVNISVTTYMVGGQTSLILQQMSDIVCLDCTSYSSSLHWHYVRQQRSTVIVHCLFRHLHYW
jgi:hypothetical protein